MHNPAFPKAAPAKSPRPPRPDYPHQTAMCPNYPDLDTSSYPVVRLCLASLSAHGESAPGQFMVGLR